MSVNLQILIVHLQKFHFVVYVQEMQPFVFNAENQKLLRIMLVLMNVDKDIAIKKVFV